MPHRGELKIAPRAFKKTKKMDNRSIFMDSFNPHCKDLAATLSAFGRGCLKFAIKRYAHEGVFIAKSKEDGQILATENLLLPPSKNGDDSKKGSYRILNPFHSYLAAAIYCGVRKTWIKPGARVLYLGAGSGERKTVSYVSDIIGPAGVVYAVECSETSYAGLVKMARKRTNIVPMFEDARQPEKYINLVGMVDVILCDVAQPDQASILELNASYCLKADGHFVISIKASCIDSTVPASSVFLREICKLSSHGFQDLAQVDLEPFKCDHTCVLGAAPEYEMRDDSNGSEMSSLTARIKDIL